MDLRSTLSTSAVFANVPADLLTPILAAVQLRDLEETDAVAIQGSPCEELILILAGRMDSAWRDSGDGLEYVGQAFGVGDFIGLTEILLDTPHPLTVWAGESTSVAAIPRNALLAACHGDPVFSSVLHRALAERLHALKEVVTNRVVNLSSLRADESLWTLMTQPHMLKFMLLPPPV